MNKKKGIIIGIFALIVTMVIGYAYFSKNIEIKGTAKAQGSFDLTYTCVSKTSCGTCEVKENTITTTSNFEQPGDNAIFDITITNNGTIPAVLKTVSSPNNYDLDKINNGELAAGDSIYLDESTFLGAQYVIFLDETNYVCGDSAVKAANITIQPGESLRVSIDHAWVDSALLNMEQPKLPEGGATMEYNVTLGFGQINS